MISRIKIRNLLVKAFGAGELSRDKINFAINCPSCNDGKESKRKLVVRLDDGRYHCWVCGIKGKNISRLVLRYKPEFSDSLKGIKISKSDDKDEREVLLPDNFINLSSYKGSDPDVLSTLKYLKNRGLNNLDIARWRILTCPTGQFRRRVIVPSFSILPLNFTNSLFLL